MDEAFETILENRETVLCELGLSFSAGIDAGVITPEEVLECMTGTPVAQWRREAPKVCEELLITIKHNAIRDAYRRAREVGDDA